MPDEHFVANPDPTPWEPTVATGHLTAEMLRAAFDQLAVHRVPERHTPEMQAEIALARWLEGQPPGTAERLLRRMYGEEADA